MKMSYFLSLLDPVAPLIDIIVQIFFDMKYFLLVLVIYMYMLSVCFKTIAQSQLDFDNLDEEEIESILYRTNAGSFWYISLLVMGGADAEAFTLGLSSQSFLLDLLFFASNFLIGLHFLNMLIAIMGGTYGDRLEVGEQIMIQDHLSFVMDNWGLMQVAFRDIKRLEYIIAAVNLSDTDDNEISTN